jgi:hypothetical protein
VSEIEIPDEAVYRNQQGELQGSVPYELRRIAQNVKSGHWPSRTFGVDIVPMLDELADRAAAARRQVLESVVEDVAIGLFEAMWSSLSDFYGWPAEAHRDEYRAEARKRLGLTGEGEGTR